MTAMNGTNALAVEAPREHRFEHVGLIAVFGVAGALHFSIAVAQTLFGLAVFCWIAGLVVNRERFEAPPFFWPLAAYGAATLVSAAFSADPRTSFIDSKQLVL